MVRPHRRGSRSAEPRVSTEERMRRTNDEVITLQTDGRLASQDADRYDKSYRSKPYWRYCDSGQRIDPPDADAFCFDSCLTKITDCANGYGSIGAWFIEVGRLRDPSSGQGGELVWRSMYAKPDDWNRAIRVDEELQDDQLTTIVAESARAFTSLRAKYGLEQSEDDAEVLEELGRLIALRAELALADVAERPQGGKSDVIHIVDADYDLLLKSHINKPTGSYRYYEDPRERCSLSRTGDLPSAHPYLPQVLPTRTSGVECLHVLADVTRGITGTVQIETSAVMPWHSKDIDAVPDWFVEMLSGQGEYSERWDAAKRKAMRGYKEFDRRIKSGQSQSMDSALVDPRRGAATLEQFICSSLQRELEDILEAAPASQSTARGGKRAALVPKVSGTSGVSPSRPGAVRQPGIFRSSDLTGPPANAETILWVMDESVRLADERDTERARALELSFIDHAAEVERRQEELRELQGAPPEYVETVPSIGFPDDVKPKRRRRRPSHSKQHGETSYLAGAQENEDIPEQSVGGCEVSKPNPKKTKRRSRWSCF